MSPRTLLALLTALPCYVAAQEVGRTLDWQNVADPNYRPAQLTSVEDTSTYTLPPAPAPDRGAAATLSESPRVRVHEIRVDGVTALDAAEVDAIIRPYLDRELGIEDLNAVRLALSQRYFERGYVNSGVVIPDQEVIDGVVVFEAIEGGLARIEIQGKPHLAGRYIRSRIERHVDEPLNVDRVRYALQWLQLDSRVERLDAQLSPGDTMGQSVLRLAVDEPKRFSVQASADNHRASSVGSELARLSLTMSNLTGYGDELTLSGATSEGADDVSASLAMPFTRWNTSVSSYYSRADAKIVEAPFDDLDIESRIETWGVILTQPVVEGLQHTLALSLGIEVKHSETELLGIPFSFSPGADDGEAKTSALLAGLDWSHRTEDRVAALRATYRHGLDMFDATQFRPSSDFERLLNPTGADGRFDLVQLQGLYLYRLNRIPGFGGLGDRGQIVVRTSMQYSADPLMSLEKLAIGGVNTVRGYSENLLVRDNGVAASLELQLPIPGYRADAHPLNLVVAPFVDYGRSWDEVDVDLASTIRDTDSARYIVGAGIGLIWQPLRGLRAQIYWGHDVADNFDGDDPRSGRSDDDLQSDGVHFALAYALAW